MAKGKSTGLVASKATIDKTLDSLFASSSGPVKAPSATRYSKLLPVKEQSSPKRKAVAPLSDDEEEEEEEDDEELSELDEELEDDDDEEDDKDETSDTEAQDDSSDNEDEVAEEVTVEPETKKKERKRKRKDEFEDLEDKYLRKLVDEDDEPSEKRQKGDTTELGTEGPAHETTQKDDEGDAPIVHESLLQKSSGELAEADIEVDKANRTLFLGNVSAEAIESSKAKKELMAHLASPLAELDASTGPHKVESLRFRSVAVAGGGMPKRAAYITKSLMSTTTKSANAYVVYSTPLAARAALKALNGSIVLDRHLRADSVAHPAPTAHRRCVFVGNLGFVDDETVLTTDADGETKAKKRTKTPADFEEGLWRVFGQHAGKVESVRLPRDPKTRVGKGFAYVQFYDANDVEGALLLDGKKYPPMLPRILRVSRAKDPKKTTLAMERTLKGKLAIAAAEKEKDLDGAAGKPKSTKYKHKATPEQQSLAGRASRLFGRAGAAREARRLKGDDKKPKHKEAKAPNGVDLSALKTPEQIVFEGRRASSKDGKPKDLKFGKTKGKKRPPLQAKNRGARRAAEWRKKGSE